MSLFDIETSEQEAKVVITPVPWDVTTSYGGGTCYGPKAIYEASPQIDSFSQDLPVDFEHKYHMKAISQEILEKSIRLKKAVKHHLDQDLNSDDSDTMIVAEINNASESLNHWVHEQTKTTLEAGKKPATLGGDHSVPFGAIQAVAEHYNNDYSILHIDAHHDFRKAYQGFVHSHASIFHNVMTSDFKPKQLVQLGIRDFCKEEFEFAESREDIFVMYDRDLKRRSMLGGESWKKLASEMLEKLTDNVYISLDIDGFDPKLCPNTGTPVPGGIDFDHFYQLLSMIHQSGKTIIGFDLVEVCPGKESEWDANVGMRVLFELCKFTSMK